MAFQMDVPDIQVHNPSPTHQVEVSTAQAITAVGGLAGEAIKGHQLSKATDSISALHEEVTTLNAAIEAGQRSGRSVFDPQGNVSTEGLPDDLAAQIRKVQERAGSRFKVLANAVAQGATTQDAAALQAEAAIRELTNQTPGFSKEIREMARQLLGYDPHGFAIRQVLNINQPARQKTDAEKAWDQAVADSDALRMIGIDMPPQTIYGNRALQKVQETNKSLADAALEMNNIDFTEWFQQTVMAPGVDIATTLSAVAQMRAEQGGIASEEQYIDAIIRQREAEKIDVRRKAAQYPGGVSNVDLARMEEMVDSKYSPIVQAFERNALGAIMARDLKVMAMINEKWGREAAPTITRILDAFPTVSSEIFNLLVNISDPKQIQLMYPKGSPVREILEAYNFDFDTGAFRETFVDTLASVGQGQPLTEKEQEFLPVVEQAVIQPVPGREKVREEFVKGLATSGAPVRAVSLLGTQVPMMKATEQEVDFFTRQYRRHVGEPGQEDTPGNLIAMVADEYMNLNEGLITQPLHLVTKETDQTLRRRLMGLPPRQREIPPKLSVRGIFYGGIESEHATPAMKKLQVYIDAVYKNGWGEAIGADKETFAQSLIDRVNGVIEARQEKAEKEAEKEAEKRAGQATPMRWSKRPSPQSQVRTFAQLWADFKAGAVSKDDPRIGYVEEAIKRGDMQFSPDMVIEPEAPTIDMIKSELQSKNDEYGLPVIDGRPLLDRIAEAESAYKPDAVSRAGAQGLMQFMPPTAKDMGLEDPFDPIASIDAAARYMDRLIKAFNGDIVSAVAAYNWGIGNVRRKGLAAAPKETRDYVRKILGVEIGGA